MFELIERTTNQAGLEFPAQLTEKYQPLSIAEFSGLDTQKKILTNFALRPTESAWFFHGPSGIGKTTMALAWCKILQGELYHVPPREMTQDKVQAIRSHTSRYPWSGSKWHFVLIDEADQMTVAARTAWLSLLDATAFPRKTIFVFTANSLSSVEDRFISRCRMLEFSKDELGVPGAALLRQIFDAEVYERGLSMPSEPLDFPRMMKTSKNNIRQAINDLDMELLKM